jgi:hypothetical protein
MMIVERMKDEKKEKKTQREETTHMEFPYILYFCKYVIFRSTFF